MKVQVGDEDEEEEEEKEKSRGDAKILDLSR